MASTVPSAGGAPFPVPLGSEGGTAGKCTWAWRAGLGANVKVNDKFTVRLGTAYVKAPAQDKYRTPRLPDDDRIWAAGGFQWKLIQKATLDFGYAHIFVSADSPSNLPNQETPTSTPVGNLVGFYNEKVDVLGVQITMQF